MKQTLTKQILSLFAVFLTVSASAQTPWKCDGRAIGTWGTNDAYTSNTNLYSAVFDASGNVTYVNKPATTGIGVNAIGFRKQDGFVYGVRYQNGNNTNELCRIDSTGAIVSLGAISGLATDFYYAGAVDVNGFLYVTRYSSPFTLYKIDVTTKTATSIGGTGRSYVDIAFDPLTNILYGASSSNNGGSIYTINITSGASTVVGSSFSGLMFGLFFTDGAELYGFNAPSSGATRYYKINKSTAALTNAGTGPSASRADACSCPFRLSHTLKARSTCFNAGQDTVFTVAITNITTTTQNATFDLTMDKRFSFTETAAQIQSNIQTAFPGSSAVVTISSANTGTNNVISINSIAVPVTTVSPSSFKFTVKAKATGFTPGEKILFQSVIDVPGNTLSLGADLSDDPLTAQIDDATTLTVCIPEGGPLPVKIADFNGQLIQKTANLNWVTEQEINTKLFVVERSFDGVNFDKLADVFTNNSASGTKNYHYSDVNIPAAAVVYYRLKAVDNDGNFKYSPIVILKTSGVVTQTIVYPTAFTSQITVNTFVVAKGKLTIALTDAVGKKVADKTTLVESGSNTINLNGLEKLQRGFYFVKIYSGDNLVETKKIIKIQ